MLLYRNNPKGGNKIMKNEKETKLMDPLLLSKRNAQLLLDAELTHKQMGEFVLMLLRYQDPWPSGKRSGQT